MGDEAPSRGGLTRRRTRITDEETAQRMLAAARAEVDEHGLTVSIDHLSYEDTIREAGVSRSAVYRRWPYKEDFFSELFIELASETSPGAHAFWTGTALVVVNHVLDRLELLTSVEGRRSLFFELCRVGAEHNFRELYGSPQWQTHIAVAATLGSIEGGKLQHDAHEALLRSEREFTERMSFFYETLGCILGYKTRPGISYETIAVLGGALLTGLSLDATLSPTQIADHRMTCDPFDLNIQETWTIPGLSIGAMFSGLIVFDEQHFIDIGTARAALESIREVSLSVQHGIAGSTTIRDAD